MASPRNDAVKVEFPTDSSQEKPAVISVIKDAAIDKPDVFITVKKSSKRKWFVIALIAVISIGCTMAVVITLLNTKDPHIPDPPPIIPEYGIKANDTAPQPPPTPPVPPAPTAAQATPGTIQTFSSCGANRRVVALTFDDGPAIGNTNLVLDILQRNNVRATFFVAPRSYGGAGPEQATIAGRMHNEGHSVQSHGYDHTSFTMLSDTEIVDQFDTTNAFLRSAGVPAATMLRPPYGHMSTSQARSIVTQRPGTVFAMWNVESNDQMNDGDAAVFNRVRMHFEENVGIGNSAVVLLHDPLYTNSANYLTMIIEYFRNLNYEFITADQCFALCGANVCAGPGQNGGYGNVFLPSNYI